MKPKEFQQIFVDNDAIVLAMYTKDYKVTIPTMMMCGYMTHSLVRSPYQVMIYLVMCDRGSSPCQYCYIVLLHPVVFYHPTYDN